MPSPQNEAFSRILIDKALVFSGWNLLDPRQVRFETAEVQELEAAQATNRRLDALFHTLLLRAFAGEL